MKVFVKSLFLVLLTISFDSIGQLSFKESISNPTDTTASIEDITAPRTDLLKTEAGNFIFGPATRIKFEIIEEESGIETTYFKVADFPFMKSDGRQMLPHELEDGEYQLLFYSIDQRGNQEAVKSERIYIDKKGPEVTPAFNMSPTNFDNGLPVFSADLNLILEINDTQVDVQKVAYSINGQSRINSSELQYIDLTQELSGITDELIKIEVIAYDYFYNISKEVIEFKISR